MAKFIEVNVKGIPRMVNLDSVKVVATENGRACLYLDGYDFVYSDESYNQVRSMIANATGGIPIEGKV